MQQESEIGKVCHVSALHTDLCFVSLHMIHKSIQHVGCTGHELHQVHACIPIVVVIVVYDCKPQRKSKKVRRRLLCDQAKEVKRESAPAPLSSQSEEPEVLAR